MMYLVQHLIPITLTHPATRAAFSPRGVEDYRYPVLGIGSLHLPLDARMEDYAGHVGALFARSMAGNVISSAAQYRKLDVSEDADAATVAAEIVRARYGNPDDGLWILIPEDVTRSRVLAHGVMYAAKESAQVKAQVAMLAATCKADPQAVKTAQRTYMQCVERAIKDPEVMCYMFNATAGKDDLLRAFNDAEYVEQAKEKVRTLAAIGEEVRG